MNVSIPLSSGSVRSTGRAHRWVVAGLALVLLGLGVELAPPVQAATLPASAARTWGTNGRVSALLPVAGKVVIAGAFSALIDPGGEVVTAGNIGLYDPTAGRFVASFAVTTNGSVTALTSAGGTVYLGGSFTSVNGVARSGLAAVSLSTGAVVTGWSPRAVGDVLALSAAGGSVFVGGRFSTVTDQGGTSSGPWLARVTTATGAVESTHVPRPNGSVRAFAPSPDAASLYLGGDFTALSGDYASAKRSAKIRLSDGSLVTSFRSGPTNGPSHSPVLGMLMGHSTLLLAVGGGGGGCAALDPVTGATAWSKKADGDVQAVVEVDGVVYCGGHFGGPAGFDGQPRQKIAAVDPTSGGTLSYAPRVDSPAGVESMATDGRRLFVGGDFLRFGSTTPVSHFAVVLGTADQTRPLAVARVDPTGYNASVELTWSPPPSDGGRPITGYVITRLTGSTSKVVARPTPGETDYVDGGLTNGTRYSYTVRAVNALGSTTSAATREVSPRAVAPTVPLAPHQASAERAGAGLSVRWLAPTASGGSPVTGYQIMRSVDGGAATVVAQPSSPGSYLDQAVTPDHTYRYEVSARNAQGPGPVATTGGIRPLPAVPATPTLDAVPVSGGIALEWDEPAQTGSSPVTDYIIVKNGIRLVTITAVEGRTSYDHLDPDVLSGQTIRYQIKAVSSAGASPLSKARVVTVP